MLSRVYCTSVHAHYFSSCRQAPLRGVWLIFQESWGRIVTPCPPPNDSVWSLHWAHGIVFALVRQSGAVELWIAMFRLPFLYKHLSIIICIYHCPPVCLLFTVMALTAPDSVSRLWPFVFLSSVTALWTFAGRALFIPLVSRPKLCLGPFLQKEGWNTPAGILSYVQLLQFGCSWCRSQNEERDTAWMKCDGKKIRLRTGLFLADLYISSPGEQKQ